MNRSLVADLGIGPEIWVFGALLLCVTLFFKFGRFWSIRNLDLVLVFALAPGMMTLVGHRSEAPWWAFVWLFLGSFLWLVRCLLDLGLTRRPLLEPNLNASGLACLAVGVIGLFVAETVSLPVDDGAKRNPADSKSDRLVERPPGESMVEHALQNSPLAGSLTSSEKPRVILKRVLACLGHVGLVIGLIAVGWRHFDRPIAGLSVATCYLLLPYSRFALVDTGQIIPAAFIVGALVFYTRPSLAGLLIGLAAGWMPASIGLLPLWAGFYRRRGFWRFTGVGVSVAATCAGLGLTIPGLDSWARVLGARSLADAGLIPSAEAPATGSFWLGIDPSYRLPVLIAYLALVIALTLLPADKNLGELIALSAALLVASQFWYLAAGGTLIVLYLPLIILMMFRPNLAGKGRRLGGRGPPSGPRGRSSRNRERPNLTQPHPTEPDAMNLTYESLAKRIDHSLLGPTMTGPELEDGCRLAADYEVASVCIKPFAVPLAARLLVGTGVQVGTTIGFPHGGHATGIKVLESRRALDDGAAELDMVINIGRAIGGEWDAVRDDIAAVVELAHSHQAIVKVIFENCYLTDDQKARLCRICGEVNADFVKTSTGYGTGGATRPDIILMREASPAHVRVKAAGGMRDLDSALAFADLGCERLGLSRTAEILDALLARIGEPARSRRPGAVPRGTEVAANPNY